MSHSKERHEKICLNCNADLNGRFCHQCGQENIEPKESFWGLVSHFFYDITHFDGKFFQTTRQLAAKPGFLPKEYLAGRRARYLHPIRMYVFSSALFFLLFFSVFQVNLPKNFDAVKVDLSAGDSIALKLDSTEDVYLKRARNRTDSAIATKSFDAARQAVAPKPGTYRYHSPKSTKDSLLATPVDSGAIQQRGGSIDTTTETGRFAQDMVNDIDKTTRDDPDGAGKGKRYMTIGGKRVNSVKEYDSIQAALPESQRDNWLENRLNKRNLELKEEYGEDDGRLVKDLITKFIHTFPYLLFISLPLYAIFLKLLYVRRRQFYYTDHGVWLIYLYIFTFINLIVFMGLDKLRTATGWDWIFGLLQTFVVLYGIWYAYKAMRKFYGQSTGKTLLKFFAFNFLATISIILLFSLFFAISVFQL